MLVHSFSVVMHCMYMMWFLEFQASDVWITKCDDKSVCSVVHIYSLQGNEIGDDGAQALGEGLQHCTYLQELKLVIRVLT